MNFLSNYIKGILIGAGAIIPGISSGVLCVIFGIYEKLLNSILNFFKDWKQNIKFLTPFAFGGLTGIIIFSNIILFLFETYPEITSFTFIGLILGCIPSIFKICNSKEKFKLHYIMFFIISFIVALLLIFLENALSNNIGIYYGDNYSFEFLLLAGFFMSIGVVVPGISSTVILMLLGVYETYLYAVSIINMRILFPMGIGLLIGGFLCMKLIRFLLNKYHSQTYYSILGFVLGSIFILLPNIGFNTTGILSIAFCILGFLIGIRGRFLKSLLNKKLIKIYYFLYKFFYFFNILFFSS